MKLLPAITICLLLFTTCKQSDKINIVYPEGGYSYPTHVEDKDTTFYCYPLKDTQSARDSFETAYSYYFFKQFDEYNLSLKPKSNPTFRLIYGDWGKISIIILTPIQIITKTQIKGWADPYHDTTKLSINERFDFDILQRFYPLNDTGRRKWIQVYLDSLSSVNPKLLDASYYKHLLDKSSNWGNEKFEYSVKKVPISKETFLYLINKINGSGYWKLPFENDCHNIPTDAAGFTLEANTPNKYNIVRSISCPDDTTTYVKACQELLNYAGMGKEIQLIWDDAATTEEPVKIRELKLEEIKEEKPKVKKKKDKH